MVETCTTTVPPRIETEHLPPVLEAPELETSSWKGEYCGFWQTCLLLEDPTSRRYELQSRDGYSTLSTTVDLAVI